MVVLSHFSQYIAVILTKSRQKSKCKIPPWGTFFAFSEEVSKIRRNDQKEAAHVWQIGGDGLGAPGRADGLPPGRRTPCQGKSGRREVKECRKPVKYRLETERNDIYNVLVPWEAYTASPLPLETGGLTRATGPAPPRTRSCRGGSSAVPAGRKGKV